MNQFEKIYELFLSKITDYNLLEHSDEDKDKLIELYLQPSLSKFKKYCSKLNYDENGKVVLKEDSQLTVDEMRIISDLMLSEWLKSFLLNSENLKLQFSTKDFVKTSPANLIKEIRELYKEIVSDNERNMIWYDYKNMTSGV